MKIPELEARMQEITPGIIHIRFASQSVLASTFMRFQEFYESRTFKGKRFTRKEFAAWYRARHGRFTYRQDWDGFNIPSWVLDAFRRGKFDPLSREEEAFLRSFQGREGTFYIIGTAGREVLEHEIAHALFSHVPDYRNAVLAALEQENLEPITAFLADNDYHASVWNDEVQAYLLAHPQVLGEEGISLVPYQETRETLRTLFDAHCKALQIAPSFQEA